MATDPFDQTYELLIAIVPYIDYALVLNELRSLMMFKGRYFDMILEKQACRFTRQVCLS